MKPIDAKLAQTYVLIVRQRLLMDQLIESGSASMSQFQEAIDDGEQSISNALGVFNYVFALIDHLARFHKTAHSLPYVSKKTMEFRRFDSAVACMKEVRNQLQHLNNDIENTFEGPLLGAIFWTHELKQYMTTFHDLGRDRSSSSIVFSSATASYLHSFCYSYNNTLYDLEAAIREVRNLTDYISTKIEVKVDGIAYNANDHYMAICMQIHPAEPVANRTAKTADGPINQGLISQQPVPYDPAKRHRNSVTSITTAIAAVRYPSALLFILCLPAPSCGILGKILSRCA